MNRIARIFYDVPTETKQLKKQIRKLKRQRNALAYLLNKRRGRRRR
jgi:hypothetical protein